MHVQNGTSYGGHSGKLDPIPIPRQGRLALAQELARAGRTGCEPLQIAVIKAAQDRSLFRARMAIQCPVEYPLDPRVEGAAPIGDGILRKHPSRFDVNRIIQKIQGLERSVRRATV